MDQLTLTDGEQNRLDATISEPTMATDAFPLTKNEQARKATSLNAAEAAGVAAIDPPVLVLVISDTAPCGVLFSVDLAVSVPAKTQLAVGSDETTDAAISAPSNDNVATGVDVRLEPELLPDDSDVAA